jgi:rfaE bifunctional protein nucleotidyltransferase chain/domain
MADLDVKSLKSIESLADELSGLRQQGSRVVMCHGVFDPLHLGHILHLQAARRFGDVLVVSVTPDRFVNKGPWRPLFNERLRAEAVSAVRVVDYVVVNDHPTAVEAIQRLRPDVYVKGSDYADLESDLTGGISDELAAVKDVGGRIEFTDETVYSASSLVNGPLSPYPEGVRGFLDDIRTRYSASEVIDHLQGLSSVRPIVIGEAIIDEYCYVTPLAKAPRESIIAARYDSLESFAGGAVSTANHLAGFCDEVTLVAMIGPDPAEKKVVEDRLAANVRFIPVVATDRGTVIKRRFLDGAHLTKMFEVQYLDTKQISGETEETAAQLLSSLLPTHDLAVVNDFGHGFLSQCLRDLIIDKSQFLALNTQSNSANLGFNMITRYQSADYCCIDLAEARLATGVQQGDPDYCGQALRVDMNASAFMITTGTTGATLATDERGMFQAPALSPTVIDRVGAGDAFFAITSPWVFRGLPDELAPFVGNCVGALQVGIVGNRTPVGPVPLYKFITSLLT